MEAKGLGGSQGPAEGLTAIHLEAVALEKPGLIQKTVSGL